MSSFFFLLFNIFSWLCKSPGGNPACTCVKWSRFSCKRLAGEHAITVDETQIERKQYHNLQRINKCTWNIYLFINKWINIGPSKFFLPLKCVDLLELPCKTFKTVNLSVMSLYIIEVFIPPPKHRVPPGESVPFSPLSLLIYETKSIKHSCSVPNLPSYSPYNLLLLLYEYHHHFHHFQAPSLHTELYYRAEQPQREGV